MVTCSYCGSTDHSRHCTCGRAAKNGEYCSDCALKESQWKTPVEINEMGIDVTAFDALNEMPDLDAVLDKWGSYIITHAAQQVSHSKGASLHEGWYTYVPNQSR